MESKTLALAVHFRVNPFWNPKRYCNSIIRVIRCTKFDYPRNSLYLKVGHVLELIALILLMAHGFPTHRR
jgi:hypothetical protein